MTRLISLIICMVVFPASLPAEQPETVHHELSVILDPDSAAIAVVDRITLPEANGKLRFRLHGDLEIEKIHDNNSGPAKLSSRTIRSWLPLREYTLEFDRPTRRVTLEYRGKIAHDLKSISRDYAANRQSTVGTISGNGVYLGAASFWYPQIGDRLVSFSLSTRLPDEWRSVSQGLEISPNHWKTETPQDTIYLIAAPYRVYTSDTPQVQAQVYLRQSDEQLAERYLEATHRYVRLYSRLIGDYPYSKFALVENFWESGYGMPSFTLLGPRVIRLPFIIHTSYPHEILHNWWGNSVYIDYDSGNWAEGLTSYLADHLIKEQRGLGAEYRRNSLQKYADYVSRSEDFPLTRFRANHGDVSQAVGYSKTLMLFHMLRKQIGDQAFIDGLRLFYLNNRYRAASFDDLRSAFEQASNSRLKSFFQQWTTRTGAPQIGLEQIKTSPTDSGYDLSGTIVQRQTEAAYELELPLFVQVEGQDEPVTTSLSISGKKTRFTIPLKQRPEKLYLDPRFEVFRQLYDQELPASLGQLFGSDRLTLILPSDAEKSMRDAYLKLARQWQSRSDTIEIVWDSEITQPGPGASWLFGIENRLLEILNAQMQQHALSLGNETLRYQERRYDLDRTSLGIAFKTAATEGQQQQTLGVISAPTAEQLNLLARKLPHYGRYSYALFEGDSVSVQQRGEWKTETSPLNRVLTDQPVTPRGIPPLDALIRLQD